MPYGITGLERVNKHAKVGGFDLLEGTTPILAWKTREKLANSDGNFPKILT